MATAGGVSKFLHFLRLSCCATLEQKTPKFWGSHPQLLQIYVAMACKSMTSVWYLATYPSNTSMGANNAADLL